MIIEIVVFYDVGNRGCVQDPVQNPEGCQSSGFEWRNKSHWFLRTVNGMLNMTQTNE